MRNAGLPGGPSRRDHRAKIGMNQREFFLANPVSGFPDRRRQAGKKPNHSAGVKNISTDNFYRTLNLDGQSASPRQGSQRPLRGQKEAGRKTQRRKCASQAQKRPASPVKIRAVMNEENLHLS